jgi:hypothetical protein
MHSITVFISHSSKDSKIASTIIQILKAAFNMSSEEIRCTSIDGFRLPLGAPIEERLKLEVYDSKALIALITPNALKSSYFLFELGARWGAELQIFPLIAGGAEASDLNDWLRNFNALNCNSESQVLQMIKDLGIFLDLKPEPADSYLFLIKQLENASNEARSMQIEYQGHFDKNTQLKLIAEMKDEDRDIGHHYSIFRDLANLHYIENYSTKNSPDFPDTLEGLIRAAGAPPNTTSDIELIAWPILNESRLNQDQRRIWNFVKEIYPTRTKNNIGKVWEYSALKPVEDARKFHEARRALAKYWDKWPMLVGFDFIRERYTTRLEVILLLAWLELALVQWTRMGGMHKQELYKLALKFDKFLNQTDS